MRKSNRDEIIFTFKNTHDAIAAERILLQAGIGARVMPLPGQIGAGCGICLRVWPEEREAAAHALADAGIGPEGLWQRLEGDGAARYVLSQGLSSGL